MRLLFEIDKKDYDPDGKAFVPCFVDLNEAIRVNEKYVKENSCDSMIERELRVMRMIADTQKI